MYSVEWTSNCLVFSYFVFLFFFYSRTHPRHLSAQSINSRKIFFSFFRIFRLSGGEAKRRGCNIEIDLDFLFLDCLPLYSPTTGISTEYSTLLSTPYYSPPLLLLLLLLLLQSMLLRLQIAHCPATLVTPCCL